MSWVVRRGSTFLYGMVRSNASEILEPAPGYLKDTCGSGPLAVRCDGLSEQGGLGQGSRVAFHPDSSAGPARWCRRASTRHPPECDLVWVFARGLEDEARIAAACREGRAGADRGDLALEYSFKLFESVGGRRACELPEVADHVTLIEVAELLRDSGP